MREMKKNLSGKGTKCKEHKVFAVMGRVCIAWLQGAQLTVQPVRGVPWSCVICNLVCLSIEWHCQAGRGTRGHIPSLPDRRKGEDGELVEDFKMGTRSDVGHLV